MPPIQNATPPPPATAQTVTVTKDNHYLFGRVVKILSETEHEVVVAFEEAGQWLKEKLHPSAVTVVAPTPSTGAGSNAAALQPPANFLENEEAKRKVAVAQGGQSSPSDAIMKAQAERDAAKTPAPTAPVPPLFPTPVTAPSAPPTPVTPVTPPAA